MALFDSHCHLDFKEFEQDLDAVIARAQAAGVTDVLIPAVTLKSAKRLMAKRDEWQNKAIKVHFALGLHPYFMASHSETDFAGIEALCEQHHTHISAIGECGIDATKAQLNAQESLFKAHIALANQLKKPLVVHHHKSHHLIAKAFKAVPPKWGGAIHAFSGSQQQAEYYIEQGFKLGVGGTITYPRGAKTRAVFAALPLDHLMLETDGPSMPLYGFQGQVNEPMQVKKVLAALASVRTEPLGEIEQALYSSTCALFSK